MGLALDNIGWSRTERTSGFPMPLTSSSSSRDRNRYCGNLADAANKDKLSSINRIAIAARASLEEVDRLSPYPAIFISVTRGQRWSYRHRKTRFFTDVPSRGGVIPEKLGRGVRLASHPIYDLTKNVIPYLWPDQKCDTLYLWPDP